jgi:predicted ATPase
MARGRRQAAVPRIEALRVENYRVLRHFELRDLTPLTVLVGPNGSGKSTVFDVFAFLSECFTAGLCKAWERRGRLKELRPRGGEGPIVLELKYRESPKRELLTYRLEIDEEDRAPVVMSESLTEGTGAGRRQLLRFRRGRGSVFFMEKSQKERLDSPELLAVSTLGALARQPHVSALRRFISGWYFSYLNADDTRTTPEAGPQERLSATGDNLPNVIQYLKEQYPERLRQILGALSRRVPRLEGVTPDLLPDGRLLMQVKDEPFRQPIAAKYVSGGTLKLLAYLTVLYEPKPPPLIGIAEPEIHLHPRLLSELAEECRNASSRTQLMVATHSDHFLNALRPEEVRVLYRGEDGYTQSARVADMQRAMAMYEAGGLLGHLWVEGFFDVGDPLKHPRGAVQPERAG